MANLFNEMEGFLYEKRDGAPVVEVGRVKGGKVRWRIGRTEILAFLLYLIFKNENVRFAGFRACLKSSFLNIK